ncbi:hypothetical protein D0C36_12675 [Mucilaginibacter conchicola]|uniref:DUF600 family protein n=1 Tax=Mucilaginibacter conchicola TaxID=2303333 RepID=A0A372NSP9_9SPHI|nr:hypothetical protein [Mucilaginibacter conchicola]RFZ92286.1 hypothetical protein D0C36_12675 [Mucilaginibacter conchicola]
MNTIQDFDDKFSTLFTGMVEIAFEFVNRNDDEVEAIYIFSSLEMGCFYNVFYRINGTVVNINKINAVSTEQYDLAPTRMMDLLHAGNGMLAEMETLFKDHNREVPKSMKMIYEPQTGHFNNKMGYEDLYKNDPVKTAASVFDGWFDDVKSQYTPV